MNSLKSVSMRQKRLQILLVLIVLSTLVGLCAVTARRHNSGPTNPAVDIDAYTFCVEEAMGDRYNIQVRYALRRQDGAQIDPTIEFDSLESSDGLRSFGESIEYRLSEDGKTIWILEEQSSPQKYDSQKVHTVILKNLRFGEQDNQEVIEGTWTVSYTVQIDANYTELIDQSIHVQIPEINSWIQINSV